MSQAIQTGLPSNHFIRVERNDWMADLSIYYMATCAQSGQPIIAHDQTSTRLGRPTAKVSPLGEWGCEGNGGIWQVTLHDDSRHGITQLLKSISVPDIRGVFRF